MKRLKIGDIVEITTSKGIAYAQYTHQHPIYGSLVRVFDKLYEIPPLNQEDIVNNEIQFSTFIPLKAAIKQKIFNIFTNLDITEQLKIFPKFKAGIVDPSTERVEVWWLWDGENEEKVGTLNSEQKKYPLREVCNDTLLVERIESKWTSDKVI